MKKPKVRNWLGIGLVLVAITIGLRTCAADDALVPDRSTAGPVKHLEDAKSNMKQGTPRVIPLPHAKTKSKNEKVQRARERIKRVRAQGKSGPPAPAPLPRPGQR